MNTDSGDEGRTPGPAAAAVSQADDPNEWVAAAAELPAAKVIRIDADHALVRARDGLFLVNAHDFYVGQVLMTYGQASAQESAMLRHLCGPGHVAVEVGANMGCYTVGLARHVGPTGRVIAIEPQPPIFHCLCANMALNGLFNARCYPIGLGAQAGYMMVPPTDYRTTENFGGTSLLPSGPGTRVRVERLDDIFDLPALRLLKIDVEGMEQQVLEGAEATIARLRPVIYVENDRQEKSQALIEYLLSLGYRLWWHLPRLFSPDNFFGVADDVYGRIVAVNLVCVPRELTSNIQGLTEVADPTFHPMRR